MTTVCAPIGPANAAGALPYNTDGSWSIVSSPTSSTDFTDVMNNTEVISFSTTAMYAGRKVYDIINIHHFPRINIELGDDREICAGETLILPERVTSEQNDQYLWQDGSTDRKYTVTETGRYTVQVTGRCGTITDTVLITKRNCGIHFPNAFSPNGDGRNDVVTLLGDIVNVRNYELHIFNRWGEEVFTNTDAYAGWDGTHKGKPVEQGVYYYYIKLNYLGNDDLLRGSISLLK